MKTETINKYTDLYANLIKRFQRDGFYDFIKDYGAEYYNCPASSKYHLAIKNGLLIHSVNLYLKFKQRLLELKDTTLNEESIILVCLFHDICKVGAYIKEGEYYKYNKNHRKGHAELSIRILEKYMDITETEKDLIKYHMGTFGIINYDFPEYTVEEWQEAIKKNYLVQVFASCDMESSKEEQYL